MTRIAEVSSTRRVICHWLSLRSRGAGGYLRFRMQKLRCGWRFIVHFEVPKHNSMSFFASCSDQSTLLLRRAKSLGAITNMRLQKIEIFRKFWFFVGLSGFCYTSPPRGNQVGDLPRALHLWFRMQKLRCGWRFIVHFEVPNHNSMSFFASCSDQSTLLLRRAKSLGAITNMRLQKIEIFRKFWFFVGLSGFCYTSPPRGNQVGDLPRALHMPLEQLAFELVWRLSMILHEKWFFRWRFWPSFWGAV